MQRVDTTPMSETPYAEELRKWTERFVGFFPPDPETRNQLHWYTPIFGPACCADEIPAETHSAIMQAVINAAAHVRRAQPDELSYATVTALIRAQDVRWAQVCIFYCEDAYSIFHDRQGENYRWDPINDDRKLSRERGLVVPDNFVEFGHNIVERDDKRELVELDEIWTIKALYE